MKEPRQSLIQHSVPALTAELCEETDGALSISGIAYRFRTDNGDPYEYTITVQAADLPALRTALGLGPDGDAFAGLLARSHEIMKRGEKTWLDERGVPCELFKWAPWATIDDLTDE